MSDRAERSRRRTPISTAWPTHDPPSSGPSLLSIAASCASPRRSTASGSSTSGSRKRSFSTSGSPSWGPCEVGPFEYYDKIPTKTQSRRAGHPGGAARHGSLRGVLRARRRRDAGVRQHRRLRRCRHHGRHVGNRRVVRPDRQRRPPLRRRRHRRRSRAARRPGRSSSRTAPSSGAARIVVEGRHRRGGRSAGRQHHDQRFDTRSSTSPATSPSRSGAGSRPTPSSCPGPGPGSSRPGPTTCRPPSSSAGGTRPPTARPRSTMRFACSESRYDTARSRRWRPGRHPLGDRAARAASARPSPSGCSRRGASTACRRIGNSLVVGRREPAGRSSRSTGTSTPCPSKDNGTARIEGDRMYGLGTTDMKAGLAVMIHLLEDLRSQFGARTTSSGSSTTRKRALPTRTGSKRFSIGCRGSTESELAVVMEPTDLKLELGCNGAMNADVVFAGKAAHSARPWMGENAITKAGEWLARLHAREPELVVLHGLEYREVFSVTKAQAGSPTTSSPPSSPSTSTTDSRRSTTSTQAEARLREVAAGADDGADQGQGARRHDPGGQCLPSIGSKPRRRSDRSQARLDRRRSSQRARHPCGQLRPGRSAAGASGRGERVARPTSPALRHDEAVLDRLPERRHAVTRRAGIGRQPPTTNLPAPCLSTSISPKSPSWPESH